MVDGNNNWLVLSVNGQDNLCFRFSVIRNMRIGNSLWWVAYAYFSIVEVGKYERILKHSNGILCWILLPQLTADCSMRRIGMRRIGVSNGMPSMPCSSVPFSGGCIEILYTISLLIMRSENIYLNKVLPRLMRLFYFSERVHQLWKFQVSWPLLESCSSFLTRLSHNVKLSVKFWHPEA